MENRQKNRWFAWAGAMLLAGLAFFDLTRSGKEVKRDAAVPARTPDEKAPKPSVLLEPITPLKRAEEVVITATDQPAAQETPGTNIEAAIATSDTHIVINYPSSELFFQNRPFPYFEAGILKRFRVFNDVYITPEFPRENGDLSVTVSINLTPEEVGMLQSQLRLQGETIRTPESYADCHRLLGRIVDLAGWPAVDQFIYLAGDYEQPDHERTSLMIANATDRDVAVSLLFPKAFHEDYPELEDSRVRFREHFFDLVPYLQAICTGANYAALHAENQDWQGYLEVIKLEDKLKAFSMHKLEAFSMQDYIFKGFEVLPNGSGVLTCPIYSEKGQVRNMTVQLKTHEDIMSFIRLLREWHHEVQSAVYSPTPPTPDQLSQKYLEVSVLLLGFPPPLEGIKPTREITIQSRDSYIDSANVTPPARAR